MDIGRITKIWEIEPIELPAEQPVAPEPAVEPTPVEEPAKPEPVEETKPADDPEEEPARTGGPGIVERKPLHRPTRAADEYGRLLPIGTPRENGPPTARSSR